MSRMRPLPYTFIQLVLMVMLFLPVVSVPILANTDPKNADTPVTASVGSQVVTGDTTAPRIPLLLRPADGSVTSDPTPELVWKKSEDPNGNTVTYTVYIDGHATYLGVPDTGNSISGNYVSTINGTEIRLIPNTGLPDGVHSWQVSAYDLSGNTSSSVLWHFTIDTLAPPITVTAIDKYSNLNLSALDPASVPIDPFLVTGPKDIYFTLVTEIYTNIALTIFDMDDVPLFTLSGQTDHITLLKLYQHLTPGSYTIQVTATDRANLVTVLPRFYLTVTDSAIVVPIPGFSPPPTVAIPPYIANLGPFLYNYPATISRITTRDSLSVLLVVSLALWILLLILFLKRRYNLALIDAHGHPLLATVTHLPSDQSQSKMYALNRRGRVFITDLGRGSTLTITAGTVVSSLCLTSTRRVYAISI